MLINLFAPILRNIINNKNKKKHQQQKQEGITKKDRITNMRNKGNKEFNETFFKIPKILRINNNKL